METLETLHVGDQVCGERMRLAGGPSNGVEVIRLVYGETEVQVCPTRGMGVLEASFRGTPVKWDSPVRGPVHPALVNLESRNKLGWLDGFTELVARCGLAYIGPPGADETAGPIDGDITLHGRVANLPACDVEMGHDDGGVYVRGVVYDCVLFGAQLRLTSETRIGGDGRIVISDVVTNCGPNEAEYQLLYHINVGPPVLEAGAIIDIDHALEVCPRDPRAAEDVQTWPECLGPTPGYAEQAYFVRAAASGQSAADTTGDGRTVVSLAHTSGKAFQVMYAADELPCLTLWKCTQPEAAGYVVGIEPGTSYPNHKSFERKHGRVPTLAPGESSRKQLILGMTDHFVPSAGADRTVVQPKPVEPLAVPAE